MSKGIHHEMILDSDFLESGKTLNYEKKFLQLFDYKCPLQEVTSAGYIGSVEEITGHEQIDNFIFTYRDVFSDGNDLIGCCNIRECTILTYDHLPIKQKPYRMPLSKPHIVKVQIQEMLDRKTIQPSTLGFC